MTTLLVNRIGGEIEERFSSLLDKDDFYLSPQNAAKYLDVSVKFIYELIQCGDLKSQFVGNRKKRIKIRDLKNWLTSQDMKLRS